MKSFLGTLGWVCAAVSLTIGIEHKIDMRKQLAAKQSSNITSVEIEFYCFDEKKNQVEFWSVSDKERKMLASIDSALKVTPDNCEKEVKEKLTYYMQDILRVAKSERNVGTVDL